MIIDYKWSIDKEFTFEMGHRVWAQKLNHPRLSISTDCACKHLHGHSYSLKVFLSSNGLDESHMVTDFKNLNFVKEFLDNNLDHKFMIDINDPLFMRITGLDSTDLAMVREKFFRFANLGEILNSTIGIEVLNSFVLVDFCPTSENICKYLADKFKNELKDVAIVTAVELWETKKSHCRYTT